MRKLTVIALAILMALTAFAGYAETVSTTADEIELTGDPASIQIGVILVGDENEGYTYAHIEGIQKAAENLGIDADQIIWKYSVAEDASCYDAAADLVDSGCNIVISNSYGHQLFMQQAAADFTDVDFVAMTGDTAKKSGMENFANAFTRVYESRFVSGVVAGMKLKELADNGLIKDKNYDENGKVLIGYVGAFPYAEVVSGYTAFYLGIKSVYENVDMLVQYTNSWFDINSEYEAASALMAKGCIIIGQHADSTGAPSAVQTALDAGDIAYSVGYNVSMLSVAPKAALTSATNEWSVYYEYALKTIINGEKVATNWAAGYDKNAVAITELGESVAAGTTEKVAETIEALKNGEINVFDVSTFTVGGATVESAFATDTDGDWTNDADEAIWDGCFHESYFQSAPAFGLRIDGITELN